MIENQWFDWFIVLILYHIMYVSRWYKHIIETSNRQMANQPTKQLVLWGYKKMSTQSNWLLKTKRSTCIRILTSLIDHGWCWEIDVIAYKLSCQCIQSMPRWNISLNMCQYHSIKFNQPILAWSISSLSCSCNRPSADQSSNQTISQILFINQPLNYGPLIEPSSQSIHGMLCCMAIQLPVCYAHKYPAKQSINHDVRALRMYVTLTVTVRPARCSDNRNSATSFFSSSVNTWRVNVLQTTTPLNCSTTWLILELEYPTKYAINWHAVLKFSL